MQLWQACVLAQIFGVGYAGLRLVLHRLWPDHNLTPWLVVVGVSIILAVYGGLAGLEPAAQLLALFSLAGWPMVLEFYGSHIWDRRRRPTSSDDMELDL